MARKRKEQPNGCMIYGSSLKSLLLLPDENAGRAIKAAAQYFLYGETPDGLDLSTQIVFSLLKSDAENSMLHFAETCERNRKIAKAREMRKSAPVVTSRDQSLPVDTNLNKSNITESNLVESNLVELKEREAAKPRRASRFSPPSLEEVEAYCLERGSKIDAQRFIDFYASKGWKVGNQSMKDWKAALRTWERRDKEKKPHAIPEEKDYYEGWGVDL